LSQILYLASQHQRKISFRLSVLSRILATDYLDFSGKQVITFSSTSHRRSSPEYFGFANSAENKLHIQHYLSSQVIS
jgi:hypothetical protein